MKKIEEEKLKKILIVALVLVIILSIIQTIIRNNKDYSSISIKTNNKEIFTINDLKVNNLGFGSSEKEIKEELGKPKTEKKETKDVYKYKELTYKGLKLTLRENYKEYILVGAEISSSRYKVGRKVRVGKNIEKVMKEFRIRNKKGNYLYGNYTAETLKQEEIKENIYFGLRTKKQVMYINRDRVDSGKTNVAELNIKYSKGKVSNIKWSYDFN